MKAGCDKKAFTLVELLVVVAIIGVLATIGIPAYRKMVARARQSEAKLMLAGLFAAEQSFLSEYGCYGNNLWGIGFLLEGGSSLTATMASANLKYYSVGFPAGMWCDGASVRPTLPSSQATALMSRIPTYFTGVQVTLYNPAGKTAAARCIPGAMSADGMTFTAIAAGVVRLGGDVDSTDISQVDTWEMNDQKLLINRSTVLQ